MPIGPVWAPKTLSSSHVPTHPLSPPVTRAKGSNISWHVCDQVRNPIPSHPPKLVGPITCRVAAPNWSTPISISGFDVQTLSSWVGLRTLSSPFFYLYNFFNHYRSFKLKKYLKYIINYIYIYTIDFFFLFYQRRERKTLMNLINKFL